MLKKLGTTSCGKVLFKMIYCESVDGTYKPFVVPVAFNNDKYLIEGGDIGIFSYSQG